MSEGLAYSPRCAMLFRGALSFDPVALAWGPASQSPDDLHAVGLLEAVATVFRDPRTRRVPIGVIGPRCAMGAQAATAEELGRRIAELGLTLLCGGKGGVMEAACRGAATAGGLTVGLLPDEEWQAANPYVSIPIASGLGPARNAIIARACPVLIAVGGEYGTLSEIAFGLQFGRRVVTLEHAPVVHGAIPCPDVESALVIAAERILGLDSPT